MGWVHWGYDEYEWMDMEYRMNVNELRNVNNITIPTCNSVIFNSTRSK